MFFLALKHLMSRKRQTLLTLFGILLGTTAYVSLSGMMLGFQSFIIDQLINNDSHLRITAREQLITEHSLDSDFFGEGALIHWYAPPSGRRDNPYILYPRAWFDRLEADSQVTAYSPQFVVQVIANRAKVSLAAHLIGSEPARQLRVTNIQDSMIRGNFSDIGTSGNRIILGEGLLKKMGAAMGETISLAPGSGKALPFKIIGVFRLGVKALDDTYIFGSLSDAQKLNGTPSRISDIAVRLTDVSQAAPLATQWNSLSEEKVQSWDQSNEGIMSVFQTQDIVRNLMTISILIVAGFGIYNILSMAVTNKRRDIAILRSMGYLPHDVLMLFFIQGLILGSIGGLLGCFMGNLACRGIERIPVSGERGLGGNHMFMVYFPFIYVRGYLLAFVSASFASFLPARAAGKLSPIDIIRSGGG